LPASFFETVSVVFWLVFISAFRFWLSVLTWEIVFFGIVLLGGFVVPNEAVEKSKGCKNNEQTQHIH
jgi:hypothetical protein